MANFFFRLFELIPRFIRKRRIPHIQTAALPAYNHAWKLLLTANTRFWGQVLLIRQALQGDSYLTMVFVRAQCTGMCVAVYAMLRHLREMTSRNITFLERPFNELQSIINSEIDPNFPSPASELTLPISRVNAALSAVVGTKMAFLGEIKEFHKEICIPEGFVITSSAYHLFLDHHGLRDEINRRLQTLEVKTLVDMFRISSELQLLIINTPLPSKLEDAIRSAYRELEANVGHRGVRVALRSSVAGEDSLETSFAGQYRTELNVSEELLFMAYKEVLASKYSLTSMNYRLSRGLKDEDLPMCVGCLAMVGTSSSGVMLTRHPAFLDSSEIFINAVHGLAKAISDGYVTPDSWTIKRTPEPHISSRNIREKPERFVSFLTEEGVTLRPTPSALMNKPSLDDEHVLALCRIGIDLENHFGLPLDIEWSLSKEGAIYFQQARPITQINTSAVQCATPENASETCLLYRGGIAASPGVATGMVYIAKNNNDLLHFPDGAVLVTSRPHYSWSALVPRAAAIVTEQGGGVFSHLANVAREFCIPALFDVPNATSFLNNGQHVTINAQKLWICEARAEPAGKCPPKVFPSLSNSPVYSTLSSVMDKVDYLTSVNPLAQRNIAENIKSLNDVAHVCQLLSCAEVLRFAGVPGILRPLAVHHPLNWWTLDLEDPRLDTVSEQLPLPAPLLPEQIPMLGVLWEGIAQGKWVHYANSPHQNHLLRLIRRLRASVRPLTPPKPRLFVVTKETTHLYLALERALFAIQIQTGPLPENNSTSLLWQWFSSKPPAPEKGRAIADLFQHRGFAVELTSDGLFTWSAGSDPQATAHRARFLGYMISHVQQSAINAPLPKEIDIQ